MKIDVTWTITAIIAVSSFLSPIAVAIINNLHQAKMRKMELDHDRQIKELNLKQQAIIRQTDICYADKKNACSEVLRCAGTFASNKKSTEKYKNLHSAIDTAFLFCSYGTRRYLDYFLEQIDQTFFGDGLSESERISYSNEVSALANALSNDLESTKPVVDSEDSEYQ